MDILYVPFAGEVDILDMARQWTQNQPEKNHMIVQYQANQAPSIERHRAKEGHKASDDANDTVYVLAHGLDSLERNEVAASTRDQTTHSISMQVLAERFNRDLSLLSHRINKIKLYFCNNVGHEQALAQAFQQHLALSDQYRIDIYRGDLHAPTLGGGHKTCQYQGKLYPVKQGRRSGFFNVSDTDTIISNANRPHQNSISS